MPAQPAETLGIPGQDALEHQDKEQDNKSKQIKEEGAGQIFFPTHIFLGIDAQQLVDAALSRTKNAGDDILFAAHNFAHVDTQRQCNSHQDHYI